MWGVVVCSIGFKFRSKCLRISHLQYADDTLCIEEAYVENLWMLKALLRWL